MAELPSILIMGAAGVIGRAASRLLSAQGYPLVLADRDAAAVEALAQSLNHASWLRGDATDPGDVAEIFAKAGPGLGCVVLAVGSEGPVGALEDCADDDFHQAMTLNVTSVWLGLKAALKVLKPKGKGSIVVLSSISGTMGMPMMSAYAAGKHAVLGLVRSAAREAAASGVRINAVCPGPVVSDMMRRVDNGLGRADAAGSIPMQRYAEPDEVAHMIAFLCSDASSYSTGSSFMLDGGYGCR
ncbi:SDR family oxidoreductase [Phenylobacterium sp.]|uniref:SDR family NAD(P)-dependent oxidoreductase n=1 Tax=Phenylobacterium sp. TaxID=1871053 RepID=UPI0025E02AC6|nr:SDR family oxidoreductase [Phenylobacterium sp.]